MNVFEAKAKFFYSINVRLSRVTCFWRLSAAKNFYASEEKQLTIVTGSDSSHFKSLVNLLESIKQNESKVSVSIWNLGLLETEINVLKQKFPNYNITKFKFEKYPAHFNIKVNAGEYAWKPVIIFDEFNKNNGLILWLDAGNLVLEELSNIKQFIQVKGFFSPYSSGLVKDWTHLKMIEKFSVSKATLYKPNLNGAIVGFNSNSERAAKLIEEWRNCALDKGCIAPEGSSRINHRQDQAALTCLAYKNKIAPRGIYPANIEMMGLNIHQDVD